MSKRTIFIISVLLCCILVLAGFWLAKREKKVTVYGALTTEQINRAKAVLEHDADEDGLKDWEEELWTTDPKNPDTDGDGTLDGEEIRLERNPLVANTAKEDGIPNDLLDSETLKTKTTLGKAEWTETDKLSREFFGKYLALTQSGRPFTEKEAQRLLDEVVSNYPENPQKLVFSESDVLVASSDDVSEYHAYGNALGVIIEARKNPEDENELAIYERALNNEDEGDLATLTDRVTHYQGFIDDMKDVPAPTGITSVHRDLLNALEILKESVEGMLFSMSDPVKSLGPTTAYPKGVDALVKAFEDINTALKEKGVVFKKGEPGFILNS